MLMVNFTISEIASMAQLPQYARASLHRLARISACLPNEVFSEITLVAWNQPPWEYLHHRNQQMLEMTFFFPPGSLWLNIYQPTMNGYNSFLSHTGQVAFFSFYTHRNQKS